MTYEVLESFGDDIKKIKSFHIEFEHREVWIGQKLYDKVESLLVNKNHIIVYYDYFESKFQSDTI